MCVEEQGRKQLERPAVDWILYLSFKKAGFMVQWQLTSEGSSHNCPLQNYSCNLIVNRELIGTVYSYGSQECSVCRNDQTVVKKEWAKTSVTPLQELFGPFTIIEKSCPTDQSSNNKHQEICLAATWRTVLETNKSWKKKDFATQNNYLKLHAVFYRIKVYWDG